MQTVYNNCGNGIKHIAIAIAAWHVMEASMICLDYNNYVDIIIDFVFLGSVKLILFVFVFHFKFLKHLLFVWRNETKQGDLFSIELLLIEIWIELQMYKNQKDLLCNVESIF